MRPAARANLVKFSLPEASGSSKTASFDFRLDRAKLRQVRRREGRYLLRTNLTAHDPAQLWTFYIQLTEVEQAFKELKHDLAVRPIYHQRERASRRTSSWPSSPTACRSRFKARLQRLAHGITPAEVIAKFKTMQMVDVHVPTTDGTRTRPVALHPARARTPHAAGSTAAEIARTTPAEDHRQDTARSPAQRSAVVVETFGRRAQIKSMT